MNGIQLILLSLFLSNAASAELLFCRHSSTPHRFSFLFERNAAGLEELQRQRELAERASSIVTARDFVPKTEEIQALEEILIKPPTTTTDLEFDRVVGLQFVAMSALSKMVSYSGRKDADLVIFSLLRSLSGLQIPQNAPRADIEYHQQKILSLGSNSFVYLALSNPELVPVYTNKIANEYHKSGDLNFKRVSANAIAQMNTQLKFEAEAKHLEVPELIIIKQYEVQRESVDFDLNAFLGRVGVSEASFNLWLSKSGTTNLTQFWEQKVTKIKGLIARRIERGEGRMSQQLIAMVAPMLGVREHQLVAWENEVFQSKTSARAVRRNPFELSPEERERAQNRQVIFAYLAVKHDITPRERNRLSRDLGVPPDAITAWQREYHAAEAAAAR